MQWIYVAVIANSILTSGHSTKEECLGHRDILQEQKIYGQCIQNTPQEGVVIHNYQYGYFTDKYGRLCYNSDGINVFCQ